MSLLRGATDRWFLRFCRHGDTDALARVFDRVAPELLRVALYLCGDRTDAEDLLQRTFLAAIESRAAYDPSRRTVPWLLGILAKQAGRLQRERARSRSAPAPSSAASPCDPAAEAEARELAERVASLRTALGTPYREVLELHLERGLNAKEIAVRLGRPAGTVRTQLVRALALLRERLPSGFVAGVLPFSLRSAVPSEVRNAVIAAARRTGPAATSTATISTLVAGGVLMSKKVLLAVSTTLLVLALGVYGSHLVGPAVSNAPAGIPAAMTRSSLSATVSPTPPPQPSPERASLARHRPGPDTEDGFGRLRIFVHWPDGSPAAGIGASAEGGDAAPNQRRLAVTGADGSCVLSHLRPGIWRAAITHAQGSRRVEVRAGEQSCSFLATVEATLRGRVVDDREHPVATAEIWIATAAAGYRRQFTIAHSDSSGAFAVPIAGEVQIGARAAGFAPSLASQLDPEAPPAELVLRLRGPGGRLTGTVRDAHGRPIAWARVLVGRPHSLPVPTNTPYQTRRVEPPGREATTDVEGHYAIDGLRPGREVSQAWAPGCAPARRELRIDAAATVCDFTLLPGASLRGTVRDTSGRPVAGASVGLASEQDWLIEWGTRSDTDGAYWLTDLPGGRCSLAAETPDHRATATLALGPGTTTPWDPVLLPRPNLRGRIVDAGGAPVPGIPVAVHVAGLPSGLSTTTDSAGRFVLRPDADEPVDLVAGEPGGPALATLTAVRPGTADLVVRLTPDDIATARVAGRVVDDRGRPLPATISASRLGESVPQQCRTAGGGRFSLGPLPPGRYTVRVTTPSHGSLALPPFSLARADTRDLGELVLQPPGRATITVRDTGGHPARGHVALYTETGQWVASAATVQGRAHFDALQPGHYFACCGGAPRAARTELDVQPAADTAADLQMVAVGRATLVVGDPLAAGELGLTVLAFEGEHFAGLFGTTQGNRVGLWLPPGRYRVEVRAGDGRRATAEVAIADLGRSPEVSVELPAR